MGTHAVDNPASSGVVAPADLYRENLRGMIDDAREVGAKPILVTPGRAAHDSLRRRVGAGRLERHASASDASGNRYSLRDYAEAAIGGGRGEGVPVIDLTS